METNLCYFISIMQLSWLVLLTLAILNFLWKLDTKGVFMGHIKNVLCVSLSRNGLNAFVQILLKL